PAATKSSAKAAPAPKTVGARAKAVRGAEQRYHQARRASILLKHVSDPTRLQVILILAEGERHVGALCAQLSQSQPAVSHHLALRPLGRVHDPSSAPLPCPAASSPADPVTLTARGAGPRPC